MKYTRDTLFYIRYNSSITEEVWEQIKDKFLELKLKQLKYILGHEYLNFKYSGFIRTNTPGESRGKGWCVDNNRQWGLTELTVEEFLNININIEEPAYELY